MGSPFWRFSEKKGNSTITNAGFISKSGGVYGFTNKQLGLSSDGWLVTSLDQTLGTKHLKALQVQRQVGNLQDPQINSAPWMTIIRRCPKSWGYPQIIIHVFGVIFHDKPPSGLGVPTIMAILRSPRRASLWARNVGLEMPLGWGWAPLVAGIEYRLTWNDMNFSWRESYNQSIWNRIGIC